MHTIYTVGYSGWTPAQLQERAILLDAVVLDIRLSPTSRRPEWRSDALARLLGDRYKGCPDLGNINYRISEPIVLANPGPGVVVAGSRLRRRNIMLLCACRDASLCHRSVAAQLISEATGAAIVHLEPPLTGVIPALTVTQPYATLIAIGAKHIETRSWATKYRGPIAIHAGQGLGPVGNVAGLRALVRREPFRSVLDRWAAYQGWDVIGDPSYYLPRGAVVAIATLVDCRPTTTEAAPGKRGWSAYVGDKLTYWDLTPQERAFGDYLLGRFAWLLADVRRLPKPIPAKGAQGLWKWDVPEGVE